MYASMYLTSIHSSTFRNKTRRPRSVEVRSSTNHARVDRHGTHQSVPSSFAYTARFVLFSSQRNRPPHLPKYTPTRWVQEVGSCKLHLERQKKSRNRRQRGNIDHKIWFVSLYDLCLCVCLFVSSKIRRNMIRFDSN